MQKPKVVFRIGKLKSWGEIGAADSHNHRTRPTPNAGDSTLNIEIRKPPGGAVEAVRETIGDQHIRSNAVLAVEVILSASPEYFRPDDPTKAGTHDQERLDAWREKMERWIKQEFPHAVSVVLHLDEATPHYQIIDVPLDERGKLNARGKYGGAERLRDWQDRAAAPVAELGIERGIAGSVAKHEKIKRYYQEVNGPLPELPAIKTRAPAPLPDRTMAEKIPMTEAKAERDERERKHAEQAAQNARERRAFEKAAARAVTKIGAKAKSAERAERRAEAAEETAAKLVAEKAAARAQADQLRALPLADVLQRVYGAKEAPDSRPSYASRKLDLPDGRQVAVTGDKWIEQGAEGGKGAINLVMHLDHRIEFKTALRLLAEHYDTDQIIADRTHQLAEQAKREVVAAVQEPVPTPTPSPERWPQVKRWLEAARGMPAKLIDALHKHGLVFADERGNAVFPRERGGAFVRGTGEGSKFKRTIGKAYAGAYTLPGAPGADTFIVEGPVDAVAIKAMQPDAHVIATGGNLLRPVDFGVPAGSIVHLAFDADPAGDRLAEQAAEVFKGAQRDLPKFKHKDWAACIAANPQLIDQGLSDKPPQVENTKERKRSRGMDGPGF